MPFDGTFYQHTLSRATGRRRTHPARSVARMVIMGLACMITLEIALPERGPVTLLFTDSQTVRQNVIAIPLFEQARKLQFTVGHYRYSIVTPDRPLTPEEQTAWLGYAKWKNYPAYPMDGPLAIDP